MEKKKINIIDQMLDAQHEQQAYIEKPKEKNMSGMVVAAWISFGLSIIIPPLGLGIGIYAYLGREDHKEIEVVSLIGIGISAFLCIVGVIQYFM